MHTRKKRCHIIEGTMLSDVIVCQTARQANHTKRHHFTITSRSNMTIYLQCGTFQKYKFE